MFVRMYILLCVNISDRIYDIIFLFGSMSFIIKYQIPLRFICRSLDILDILLRTDRWMDGQADCLTASLPACWLTDNVSIVVAVVASCRFPVFIIIIFISWYTITFQGSNFIWYKYNNNYNSNAKSLIFAAIVFVWHKINFYSFVVIKVSFSGVAASAVTSYILPPLSFCFVCLCRVVVIVCVSFVFNFPP